MRVLLHSFPFLIHVIFLHPIPFPMSCFIHIFYLYNSVAPRNPIDFLSSLVILHHLQTDLYSCLLLLSSHSHIQKILLVPKLITVVPHFSLLSIQIFHPLLLFSFSFLSDSIPSSSLMFLSILQCIPTTIVILLNLIA